MSAIIAYFPIATPPTISGPTNWGPLVSHRFGRVYTISTGSDPASGMRMHDAWPNGSELYARVLADIPTQVGGTAGIFPVWTLTYNTEFVVFSNGTSNSETVTYVRQRDIKFAGYFGKETGASPSGGSQWLAPGELVSIQDSRGRDFVIATTIVQSSEINSLDVGMGQVTPLGPMNETRAVLGALPDGSGTVAYALGYHTPNGTNPLTLYSVTPTKLTVIGTVSPAQIDPTWSNIDDIFGIAIDQTDGNPICAFLDLTDSPVVGSYLVKLNKATAAVIWKYALPNGSAFSDGDLQKCLIVNQRFYYLTSNQQVAVINTANGAQISLAPFNHGTISPNHGSQISEDVVGSVYFMGGWSEGSTHPNYFGTYMGPPGNNHGVGNAPIRYFPDIDTPNPPTPAIQVSSRQRSWTFTLDGHKFYVLDLGTQGTLLYDTTTGSWSQFVTQAYFNWNFRNGTMWGQRIVGGDTDTPQIYEMSPSSMLDNGVTPIVHISTGALIKRTRTYSSLAAVRLALSVGLLDNINGATVLLSMSDDQGQTWTDMNTVALVEGDFSQEIAWQGLGSFAAPGRIFRITDVGGFLRIDGCDGELDDFDEDNADRGGG